ncbi:MAG: CHAP domain-containing protein [Oscillibacter sp.]|nr:CHAP domain-containing protein [uncultured Oscillibacter sp.]MCI8969982.1 CHAP domain-containing protein [Oscillibacter sp.]
MADMTPAERVLSIARGELNVKESPAGSNRVKYNDWFYGREVSGVAYPWCMAFVQWVFDQAGEGLPCKTASCSALLNWYEAHRPAQVVKAARPGDIVLYSFGHTGVVEAAGDGTVTAIEGNTSPGTAGSQANGGMVCRRTRKTALVTAYLRPLEEKEVNPMDNTPSPAHKEGVEWAVKNGILAGDGEGDLKLTEPVTRQQMCTMLKRLADQLEKN